MTDGALAAFAPIRRALCAGVVMSAILAAAHGVAPAVVSAQPPDAEDVADIPSREFYAGGDNHKRYFLIGPKADARKPKAGYKLLVALPGGDGGADFHPFVKRIAKHALGDDYLVAQPVAPRWSPEQAEKTVWPTKQSPWKGMKFSTEEFIEAVIADVADKHAIDKKHVYTLSWSSGGPAAYAISIQKDTAVRGSFVAMSVFHEKNLPGLKRAKGRPYYLYHSKDDRVCPFRLAEQARDTLKKAGAKVQLREYDGGHGWRGDVYGEIRRGMRWLEKSAGKATATRSKEAGKDAKGARENDERDAKDEKDQG